MLRTSCLRMSSIALRPSRWLLAAAAAPAGSSAKPSSSTSTANEDALRDKVVEARVAIQQLWRQHASLSAEQRHQQLRHIMDTYSLATSTPRESDISGQLGEALDWLILMHVPLAPGGAGASSYLERALRLAGRAGVDLPIRMIQHIFARAANYGEAVSLFHTLRRCNVRMNMHGYYAMVYCLQRLEEGSWGKRHRDEALQRLRSRPNAAKDAAGPVAFTEEALTFIVHGCDNQLLPETKPWLGRVVFADAHQDGAGKAGAVGSATADYDALGEAWATRFRNGNVNVPPPPPPSRQPSSASKTGTRTSTSAEVGRTK